MRNNDPLFLDLFNLCILKEWILFIYFFNDSFLRHCLEGIHFVCDWSLMAIFDTRYVGVFSMHGIFLLFSSFTVQLLLAVLYIS